MLRRRADDHDVLYAIESLRGATDDELLTRAFSEGRILLTEDKDFGELVYRLRRPTHGIVLLRFDVADRAFKIPRLVKTVLLPFRGKIAYDGLLSSYNIFFGSDIKGQLKIAYRNAKEREGIITDLVAADTPLSYEEQVDTVQASNKKVLRPFARRCSKRVSSPRPSSGMSTMIGCRAKPQRPQLPRSNGASPA